jgi:hypothetical protein
MVDQSSCLDMRCAAHVMTLLQFRRLRGEYWDGKFNKLVSLRAKQLHDEVYKEAPKKQYSRRANRNSVNFYPCGILEQAYRQIRAEGVPLITPGSALDRQLAHEEEYRKNPSLDPRRAAQETSLKLRTLMQSMPPQEDPRKPR